MRLAAVGQKKKSPSRAEIYVSLKALEEKGLPCQCCHTPMRPTCKRVEPRGDVLTMQHLRNGRIEFWCSRCNLRHGNIDHDPDTIARLVADGKSRWCPVCRVVLPMSSFGMGRNPTSRQGVCDPCNRKRSSDWYHRNKAKK